MTTAERIFERVKNHLGLPEDVLRSTFNITVARIEDALKDCRKAGMTESKAEHTILKLLGISGNDL